MIFSYYIIYYIHIYIYIKKTKQLEIRNYTNRKANRK